MEVKQQGINKTDFPVILRHWVSNNVSPKEAT